MFVNNIRDAKKSGLCVNDDFRLVCLYNYCAILVRRSSFRWQASPRVSPRESTQQRKVELWAKNIREFCPEMTISTPFRNLLHAVKLRGAE